MMRTPLLAFLLIISFSVTAQRAYEMTKLGQVLSDADLDSLYRKCLSTMVIINNIAYCPSNRCIAKRHYGSSYDDKSGGSTSAVKTAANAGASKSTDEGVATRREGSEDSERAGDDGVGPKKLGADSKNKNTSSGASLKKSWAANQSRTSASGKNKRTSDDANSNRTKDDDKIKKSSSSQIADRNDASSSISKALSSDMDTRHVNGYTLFIKCKVCEGGFEIVDMLGMGEVKVYDGVRLRKIADKTIEILYL